MKPWLLLLLEGPYLIFTRWLPAPHPSDLTDKAPPHRILFYSHHTLQHRDSYSYVSVYPVDPLNGWFAHPALLRSSLRL